MIGAPGIAGGAQGAYQNILQPQSPEDFQKMFQQSVVDPAMLNYEQQVLPSIQQRFVDVGAGSSSAMNQALGQSAQDLTTMLGQQYGQFHQQGIQNQLGALGQLGGMAGQRTYEPLVHQSGGILGPLIGAAGTIGAGAAMSSASVKENIREYSKGLDVIADLDVKIYDYIEEWGGAKDNVGVIAEKVPEEIQQDVSGVNGVSFYGLIGLLINSVKELNHKITQLEAA